MLLQQQADYNDAYRKKIKFTVSDLFISERNVLDSLL